MSYWFFFTLQYQDWIVAIETVCSRSLKYLPSGSLQKTFTYPPPDNQHQYTLMGLILLCSSYWLLFIVAYFLVFFIIFDRSYLLKLHSWDSLRLVVR
jgi:hypothetical protein